MRWRGGFAGATVAAFGGCAPQTGGLRVGCHALGL